MTAAQPHPLNSNEGKAKTEERTADELPGLGSKSRDQGDALDKDDLFELLKNSRRREVIRYLRANDGQSSLSDLAEHIAAKENGIEVSELSSDQRKRVYIGLYQCHLPKMNNHGVIEYDKNRGTVELEESATQLVQYMDPVQPEESTSTNRTLYAAIGVVFIVMAGAIGLGPLSLLPAITWTAISVGAIIVLAGLEVRK